MRRILFLLLLLSAQPVLAQESVVRTVRAKYPTPLGTQHAAFLVEVGCATGKGLLRKDTGTHVVLADGTPVAQDIVMERDGSHHYDILGDGEGAATPAWQDKGPIDASRYVALACNPTIPVPPMPPAPDPDLIPRLQALERRVAELTARLDGLPLPVPPTSDEHIRDLIDAAIVGLKVECRTGRSFGHAHGCAAELKK